MGVVLLEVAGQPGWYPPTSIDRAGRGVTFTWDLTAVRPLTVEHYRIYVEEWKAFKGDPFTVATGETYHIVLHLEPA